MSAAVHSVPTLRSELRAPVATMQKSASSVPVPRLETPSAAAAFDAQYARLLQLRSGLFGALQQHAVQIHARIDQQRTAQDPYAPPRPDGPPGRSRWMIFFGTLFSSRNG